MSPKQPQPGGSSQGPSVDSAGIPVIDPTENVIALVAAEKERANDVRVLTDRVVEEKIHRMEEGLAHLREIAILRAEHYKEIREQEANRVNAVRQVDVNAVSTAADRAQAAIQALAATTRTDAETLRNLVTTTATTIASQLDQRMGAVTERIGSLEKSSYTGAGKQAYADPAMADMMAKMERLLASQAGDSGRGEGSKATVAYIVAGISAVAALIGMAIAILKP